MTDEIKADATKALADVKADIVAVGNAEAKAKAWYKSHLFYAGAIVGALIALIVHHFV